LMKRWYCHPYTYHTGWKGCCCCCCCCCLHPPLRWLLDPHCIHSTNEVLSCFSQLQILCFITHMLRRKLISQYRFLLCPPNAIKQNNHSTVLVTCIQKEYGHDITERKIIPMWRKLGTMVVGLGSPLSHEIEVQCDLFEMLGK
jgi:hypothetical protein